MGAFNAEVTVSPWIAPAPYAHGYPTILVLLLWVLWEAAFAGVLFFPLGIWDAESRIILSNVSRSFGLSLSVLGRFSLLGAGLGPSIKRARVVKFFGPTIALKILLSDSSDGEKGFGDIGPLSWLVKSCPPLMSKPLCLPETRSWRLGI